MAKRAQTEAPERRTILGVEFFCGSARQAVEAMRGGGLLVVPAAPALKDLETNPAYREALVHSDLAITDSALMVLIWNLLMQDHVPRVSGLAYMRELLLEEDLGRPGNTVWVMASPRSAQRNLAWLRRQGIEIPQECVYMAPLYGEPIDDPELLGLLDRLRPQHVVVTVGGGTQERLGLYLKRRLGYRPAIHCIGAAIAFLSGDQVRIPPIADKLYIGWLLRTLSSPLRYAPRYWSALRLPGLMVRYRSKLPGETS